MTHTTTLTQMFVWLMNIISTCCFPCHQFILLLFIKNCVWAAISFTMLLIFFMSLRLVERKSIATTVLLPAIHSCRLSSAFYYLVRGERSLPAKWGEHISRLQKRQETEMNRNVLTPNIYKNKLIQPEIWPEICRCMHFLGGHRYFHYNFYQLDILLNFNHFVYKRSEND